MPIFDFEHLKFGDTFIKLNEFAFGHGGEHKLDDAFLKIDVDFQKLSSADGTDAFLKVERNPAIKGDFSVIGDFFHKLSVDFFKISDVALKVDEFVIKLTNAQTTTSPTSDAVVVALPAVQDDFLKVDATLKSSATDLGALSGDFLKLDTAPNLESFKVDELKVSADFLKVSTDMTDAGAAFAQLGNDFVKLGSGDNANSVKLDDAYKLLGGELLKVGTAFDAVGMDWLKLSQDLTSEAGGGGVTTTVLADALSSSKPAAGPLGTDLLQLDHDFLLLNQAIGGTAPGAFKVIDALFDQNGVNDHKIDQLANLVGGGGDSDHHH